MPIEMKPQHLNKQLPPTDKKLPLVVVLVALKRQVEQVQLVFLVEAKVVQVPQ
jgi:hypothetical protein